MHPQTKDVIRLVWNGISEKQLTRPLFCKGPDIKLISHTKAKKIDGIAIPIIPTGRETGVGEFLWGK